MSSYSSPELSLYYPDSYLIFSQIWLIPLLNDRQSTYFIKFKKIKRIKNKSLPPTRRMERAGRE
jgi:hypothetical protein